ncbi:MAG: hypothetical protein KKC11_07145 [Candidatus Omnitrophica bacterium]|nr:hypothetical protein [Candidatus Omnitrophota bacterium]MBU1134365.1 hypothetical protein [Candidatus Omnitrophota bacterium]MBU1367818.1 hypothetical protein [Candidatus Omnitrophota bacterium]MBU1524470.1 hypothetical protein [Candidatus Omnitrophota bacterium]MBU1811189.1 hypothetical protein [Candidatus Omnitrophota bacterium]
MSIKIKKVIHPGALNTGLNFRSEYLTQGATDTAVLRLGSNNTSGRLDTGKISQATFSRSSSDMTSKHLYVKTFGWPYIPVRRDDFGVIEEDKWFGVKGLGQNKSQFS